MRSNAAQALRANVRGARSGLPNAGAFGDSVSAHTATATTAKNAKLGQQFESMALSQLLAPMWEGLQTDGPFGGGQAEETMRSFYVDAIAKEMAKKGGIGISAMMQKELLKLQGAA